MRIISRWVAVAAAMVTVSFAVMVLAQQPAPAGRAAVD